MIISALGFSKGDIIFEIKTGRRAEILAINPKRVWRTSYGKKMLTDTNEFEFVYRWLEPAKGRTRHSKDGWVIDQYQFQKRFKNLDPESSQGRLM